MSLFGPTIELKLGSGDSCLYRRTASDARGKGSVTNFAAWVLAPFGYRFSLSKCRDVVRVFSGATLRMCQPSYQCLWLNPAKYVALEESVIGHVAAKISRPFLQVFGFPEGGKGNTIAPVVRLLNQSGHWSETSENKGELQAMAVSLTYIVPNTGATPPTVNNFAGALMIVDVIASADGDTTATIPHLMGSANPPGSTPPLKVTITPLISQALTALSAWTAATGAANVVLTKLASTGSGNAGAQLRVHIEKPNSITF